MPEMVGVLSLVTPSELEKPESDAATTTKPLGGEGGVLSETTRLPNARNVQFPDETSPHAAMNFPVEFMATLVQAASVPEGETREAAVHDFVAGENSCRFTRVFDPSER